MGDETTTIRERLISTIYEGSDFEGDLVKLYSKLRIRMSEKFEDSFGPAALRWFVPKRRRRSKSFARHTNRPRIAVGKPVEIFVDEHWDQFREIWVPRNNSTGGYFLIHHRSSVGKNGIQPRVRYEERTSALEDDTQTMGGLDGDGEAKHRTVSVL